MPCPAQAATQAMTGLRTLSNLPQSCKDLLNHMAGANQQLEDGPASAWYVGLNAAARPLAGKLKDHRYRAWTLRHFRVGSPGPRSRKPPEPLTPNRVNKGKGPFDLQKHSCSWNSCGPARIYLKYDQVVYKWFKLWHVAFPASLVPFLLGEKRRENLVNSF